MRRISPTVRSAVFMAASAALFAMAGAAEAADVKAGRQKALQCQTCHGLDGRSKLPEAPNLSGQIEPYLAKSLQDYKTGARKNEMMSVVAANLSDADIADLAAYYAAIEIEVVGKP